MIIVEQNQANILSLTLTESTYDVSITGSTTGYTLTLENEITKEIFSGITITDVSGYIERYNQFILTLTGLTEIDYSNSIVYLKDDGFYTYKVYYVADSETELIERGFLKVNGTQDEVSTISLDNSDGKYFEI